MKGVQTSSKEVVEEDEVDELVCIYFFLLMSRMIHGDHRSRKCESNKRKSTKR